MVMALPDDVGQNWLAIWLTAALGALGVAWKSWFSVRKDVRDDRKSEVVNGTYEAIIRALRDQLAQEREARMRAEAEVIELRKRLAGGGE